ncbi:unnamed protein product [Adineta steineri]|uniref:Uncharacterized protein n=1 Tax=Adineta steineri TaxID=433720 RepID=A0A819DG79_9BILA|nr:unnamed protein product [Adineta steineri]
MILTISDDNTVSTSSALIIKAQTYKCSNRCELEKNIECSIKARIKIAQLSSAEQLRYEAIEFVIDIDLFKKGILIMYLSLMAFKPQMYYVH